MKLVEWYLNSFLINSSFPFHFIVLFNVSVHSSFLKILLALKLPVLLVHLKLYAFIYGYSQSLFSIP